MTRRCRRASCRADLDDDTQPYCSVACRRIDTVLAGLPHSSAAVARMGRGACVADALPWMDARAAS